MFGPGGVGKSYMLRAIWRQAEAQGAFVLYMDADDFAPSIRAFSDHFCQIVYERQPAPAPVPIESFSLSDALTALADMASHVPVVVLIDTYELIEPFDYWLRETFVGQLPRATAIVIAGRNPLRQQWAESPHWRDRLLSIPLASFSRDVTADYLALYGIEEKRLVDKVHSFTKGHPLTLSLTAHMADTGFGDLTPDAQTDILTLVAEKWRRDIPDAQLQQLVEIAALLQDFDEPFLSYVYGQPIAAGLFEKLVSLSLIKPVARGWTMHDLLRQAISSDLQLRSPARCAHIRNKAARYIYERIAAGERTEENVTRFFYYAGDEFIRSVIFQDHDATVPNLYVEPVTGKLPHALLDEAGITFRTDVTFAGPTAQSVVPYNVSYDHNARERDLHLEMDVEALGPNSVYMLKDETGMMVGFGILVPIHRETLPVLASMPVTRAYFASLSPEERRSYETTPARPAGIFVRSLIFANDTDSYHRSYFLYKVLPLLLSHERIIASTPLPLYEQLLRRFGFAEVAGATHYDYGPDQPSPTFLLDLRGHRLGAYLQSFLGDHQPELLREETVKQFGLTKREAETLALVLEGRSNAEIAQALFVAEITVKKHLTSIFKKTGTRNRHELSVKLLG